MGNCQKLELFVFYSSNNWKTIEGSAHYYTLHLMGTNIFIQCIAYYYLDGAFVSWMLPLQFSKSNKVTDEREGKGERERNWNCSISNWFPLWASFFNIHSIQFRLQKIWRFYSIRMDFGSTMLNYLILPIHRSFKIFVCLLTFFWLHFKITNNGSEFRFRMGQMREREKERKTKPSQRT